MSVERLREAHERGNFDGDVDGGNHFDVSPDPSSDCLTCWAVSRIAALEEALRADVIRDVLREEAWQGRWNPLPETNIYPLAVHTADVLAKALAGRTNTASARQSEHEP